MKTRAKTVGRRAHSDVPPRRAPNLRAMLASCIRSAIMRGEYSPGSPLGEVELAQRFGASRGPVREALIQLEREYLVRAIPNRGCFVTTMTEQEFDEIVTLRSVLEPLALESARNHATPKDLKDLSRRLGKMESLARSGDQRSYIQMDYEFHVAIWELSRRPLLAEVLKRISAPVFVFESIVEERYRRAHYDMLSDARAHALLVEYLGGKTDKGAHACLQPVLELATHAEKPIVFERRRGSRVLQ